MKDMFVNYDNEAKLKKRKHRPVPRNENTILESLDNIAIIQNVLGNEIGVKVRYGTAFTLYLYLDGWVENSTINDLMAESIIQFNILDLYHRPVVSKEVAAINIFNPTANYLTFEISEAEARALTIDSYRLSINLVSSFGNYELFSESDGLLIVR